ncbi:MAG: hypothetical protein ACYS67_08235 [Planctomycetota bacterium]|jgi:parallel beta-helix repeat protein
MEQRRRNKLVTPLIIAILISITIFSTTYAGWAPLTGDLIPISSIPAGELVVGNKLFTDFTVSGFAYGGPPTPSPSTILVQGGQNEATGDYGIRLRFVCNAGSDQFINASINFKVSILTGYDRFFIQNATLWLATASAAGTGLVQATENIYDADFMGNSLTVLSNSVQEDDYGIFLTDSSNFMLYGNIIEKKELWARTGITIQGGTNGSAGLHEVFLLYSQVPKTITILDGSCELDFLDFAVLASQWQQPPGIPSADIAPWPNGNGIVDVEDLAAVANFWLDKNCDYEQEQQ